MKVNIYMLLNIIKIIKTNKLNWPKRIQIASDLAKAMFYLHSKKIIHRDLKAKNLLVRKFLLYY